jgi:ATP-dependent RNA helicase SUPV3L1/SUV3
VAPDRDRVPVSHRLKVDTMPTCASEANLHKIARRNPVNYAPAVARALGKLRDTLRKTRPYEVMGMKQGPFWEIFDTFSEDLLKAIRPTADGRRPTSPDISTIADDVAMAIRSPGVKGLTMETQIRFGFYNRVMQSIFSKKELDNHLSMGDFRYPMEWFPKARSISRVLHLHVGPTNSGKTYNALKRLEESKGLCVYAGPLRLLAQEIYARMNARGKPTWLITGDDKQPPRAKDEANPDSMGISCTVEMVPIYRHYDIAVIDEIQMLADEDRGTSWTNALIGLPAKELHLCGEERAVELVQHIARSLGEELIIHRYERLSPLEVMDKPLRGLQDLQKGDCVVCFSILQIQKMKVRIERMTGRKAAIVYGGLPAEIRAHQAHMFNDPNNDYDFLVASDAIGMGLNL